MKFFRGKKEFTLLFIPDANRRTVRIKLPHYSLYMAPALIVLIWIGIASAFYLLHTNYEQTMSLIKQTFNGQERQLSRQITLKNSELEKLQAGLIDISQQTRAFNAKLEVIKKLKNAAELITLSGKASADGVVVEEAGADIADLHTALLDMGGPEVEITPEDAAILLDGTKQSLTMLVTDLTLMLGTLAETEAMLQEAEHLASITPTLWPVASRQITSRFGMRRDPFTNKPSMHTGMDIASNLNDPVYAAAEGQVILAEWDSQRGNHIRIDHTGGLQTEYLHLNKMLVKNGDKLLKGQLIGLVGTTGRSTGAHLHYEVLKHEVPIDPSPYLTESLPDY
ncbi:M23 family metallopeptidase [Paenibacillus eucommiae]|uniref:Septal ring factor EnvC (AmiA/AmiB activator) n=1 Tax=Paenibacillus eucommiae TaxID=1355755 RepID=A0ABS4J7E7_9BACL|nr:M23 family metallopeptidase [Paenibacillus eucommiae]MBP1995021.1 septal ring factor EnvC (AmiA/AmiB activator) [Paenibacillus eucommiae]